ncbi:MAG: exodeoxyribonuclease V subunit alpha [Acidobacteria bacterium]|nr:exodeoxyribonuclease V subunit alpha [Acidobacteriota bacterium]
MSTAREALDRFMKPGSAAVFGSAELAAADLLQRRSGIEDELVLFAAALAVWSHRSGHACLDLGTLAGLLHTEVRRLDPKADLPPIPEPERLRAALHAADTVVRILPGDQPGTVAEAMADARPLVLFGDLLHSQRQFADERLVAEGVAGLMRSTDDLSSPEVLAFLQQVLPLDPDDPSQHEAGLAMLRSPFTVLVGGPGTGKTYTLTRCLLAFLQADPLQQRSIAVCAPTGKAATRAREMLEDLATTLDQDDTVPAEIVERLRRIEPSTIHRLLGHRRGRQTRFAHDATRRLPHDLVIIDETSMVPLQLMSRLIEALRPEARLFLVGDEAQLESVESGSVLRDLTAPGGAVEAHVHRLRKLRRVAQGNPIAELAPLIRDGDADSALARIRVQSEALTFIETRDRISPAEAVIDPLIERFASVVDLAAEGSTESIIEALRIVAENKLLCGARRGPLGVEHWNDVIDRRLGLRSDDVFAPGRAVLITENSPRTGLVNGDVGIVIQTPDGIRVGFLRPDGLAVFVPAELPESERAFAMTIHKSQGSEYGELVTVMLPEVGSPLLTRELLYTAITRAKSRLCVIGSPEAFCHAVTHPSERVSGLQQLLTAVV